MSKTETFITTIDNPYSPFTEWDKWLSFDEQNGYFTLSYLARISKTSDDLSLQDEELAIDIAIEEILKENILGIYKRSSF